MWAERPAPAKRELMLKISLVEKDVVRFWGKVRVGNRKQCWPWLGGKDRDGYGDFKAEKRHYRAHRVSFTLMRGPVPEEKELDHDCRLRSCCNPWHLTAKTTRENILEARSLNPAAINTRKTHCKHGHLLLKENLRVYTRSNGYTERKCRTCHRLRQQKSRCAVQTRRP